MKKILSLVLAVFVAGTAYADSCATMLAPPFTEAQANALCRKDGLSIAISQVPQTDNTYDLGSASKQFRTLYAGTSIVNAGTTTSAGLMFPTTAEEAVAGAGTTVTDAAALSTSKHIHQLTGANGTLGWKFGTSVAGQFEILLNTTAGVPKVYGASGGTCNGGAANAACTLVTGIVAHICYSTATDTWICS